MSSAAAGEVCVTGAGGYIASWLVKLLLERGYRVRGTVRDPADPKNAHLLSLPNASTHLKLVAGDLNTPGAFDEAVAGCVGVFHTASPFFHKNGSRENLVVPAVNGTTNVLDAVVRSGTVKRVVLTSSMAAVTWHGGAKPADHVFTEADWSDTEACERTGAWYLLSKTLAEKAGWDHQEQHKDKYKLVVINPTLVEGPLLQPTLNTSCEQLVEFLKGQAKVIPNKTMGFVDVRDVAELHLNAYEKESAEGRHLGIIINQPWVDTVEVLRRVSPPALAANIPTAVEEGTPVRGLRVDNSKGEALLGHPLRSLEETLRDTVASLEANGFLA